MEMFGNVFASEFYLADWIFLSATEQLLQGTVQWLCMNEEPFGLPNTQIAEGRVSLTVQEMVIASCSFSIQSCRAERPFQKCFSNMLCLESRSVQR